MKFWGIFRFELAYQLRRPWPWLFFAVLLVLSFLMSRDASLAEALFEEFLVNSPFAVAKTTVFGSLIWLLIAAPVAGEAAARDVATRMYPLVYTASVRESEFLGGRFLAALVINAFLLLAVQAGILLGVYLSGADPSLVGPFRPAAYLTSYAFISLPNAFVATAVQFALAARTGRTMAGYVGSFLLFFMGFFIAGALLFGRALGTLLDPIGVRFIVEDLAYLWTTVEKNVRLVGLEGSVLTNRMVWTGVGLVALVGTLLTFRFVHRAEGALWSRWTSRGRVRRAGIAGATLARPPVLAHVAAPKVERTFGFAIQARKALAIAWVSFRSIARSLPGLALLVGIPLLTVPVVIDQMESAGVPVVPTTALVLRELTASLSAELSRWVIVPFILVFFAGELVWRERDAGLSEITDAMPGSDWVPLVGKFLGLGLVIALFLTMLTGAGMLAQTIRGYQDYEVGLYLQVMLGLQLVEYLLFALLALVVHAIVDEKYIGHLVAVLAYVFIAVLASMLGIEHSMLVYGAGPTWSYTEMTGFGGSLMPWLWFKLYWAAWAILLAVVGRLLWSRGKARGWGVRMALARQRFAGATAYIAAAALVMIVGVGGFVFYNTNVLNEYQSRSAVTARRAEYEQKYGRFQGTPQPQLAATTLRVELYPDQREANVRGSHRLVNSSTRPIDTVLVATSTSAVETRTLSLDRAATLTADDPRFGHRVYTLAQPLQPGDSMQLDFEVHFGRRGFANRGIDPSVSAKGSAFTGAAWLPFVGYQRERELVSAADRREYGLPARPVIASLYSTEEREPTARGGGIAFDATIGTSEDQTAVAPGALRRTWTEGGRRYFHYTTDAPIGREWSFFSARYAVHEDRWNDVTIRMFHHPAHTAHIERTVRVAKASLEYYSREFGPYPYRHLTIVEGPGAPGTGLHADASMISHGEGFPRWVPPTDASRFDFPGAVMAHEMAHQWTLPYAAVEGAPFMSEGLAWYSAMGVVRATGGEAQLRRLLATMRQPNPYPPIRRGEPLLRALDPYLSYRRGPFALYALSEYIGASQVNGALRRLIAIHDAPGAAPATTLDLYRELKAVTPDSLGPMLRDLFEINAYWQLDARGATARQTPAGTWEVTLDVGARKMVYDSAGTEREAPMDQWVEVGVFGAAAEGAALGAPLHVAKHRVQSGGGRITVTVSQRPAVAGVDPYHLLDWEHKDTDDNITPVKISM
ncbi:MAG: hypothetical protein V4617_04115 [Gemmatimonadota bacterium]